MSTEINYEKAGLLPLEAIVSRIYVIRGIKVMLDSDLARLYGVKTKYLNQQVRRNIDRFPLDFMFPLTASEATNLRLQIATSSFSYGGRRYQSLAYTEHGVAMLSSVLHSKQAIRVNIGIMRAFSKLREILATNRDLADKLSEMEKRYDKEFVKVFEVLRALTAIEKVPPQRQIGFTENKIRK